MRASLQTMMIPGRRPDPADVYLIAKLGEGLRYDRHTNTLFVDSGEVFNLADDLVYDEETNALKIDQSKLFNYGKNIKYDEETNTLSATGEGGGGVSFTVDETLHYDEEDEILGVSQDKLYNYGYGIEYDAETNTIKLNTETEVPSGFNLKAGGGLLYDDSTDELSVDRDNLYTFDPATLSYDPETGTISVIGGSGGVDFTVDDTLHYDSTTKVLGVNTEGLATDIFDGTEFEVDETTGKIKINTDDMFDSDTLEKNSDGKITVKTTDEVTEGSTTPITSGAVYVTVGNIEALLAGV